MPSCPRCSHDDSDHWPDHGESTTACVPCLNGGEQTTEPDGSFRGTCCHSATSIREAATS